MSIAYSGTRFGDGRMYQYVLVLKISGGGERGFKCLFFVLLFVEVFVYACFVLFLIV